MGIRTAAKTATGTLELKIVTFTTDGDSREDGNVYYAKSVLVEDGGNPALLFKEAIFGRPHPVYEGEVENGCVTGDYAAAIAEIRSLGYSVRELPEVIVLTTE